MPVLCKISSWGARVSAKQAETHRRCAVQKLTLFGVASLSSSASADHVWKLSVPLLGSQACRLTWPAAGINAIMAFACIAAQLTAASQGSSAARSREAGSTAHIVQEPT